MRLQAVGCSVGGTRNSGDAVISKRRVLFLAALLAVTFASPACFSNEDGEEDEPNTSDYEASDVIAIVQGWPLLHAADYECGTATVPLRTVLSMVARREFISMDEDCGEDADGSEATRSVRLARNSEAWIAEPGDSGRWIVTLDPGSGRTYTWAFDENGPILLPRGGEALVWPLFNWASQLPQ